MYVTHQGIEKIVYINHIPAGWFSRARVELIDKAFCFHNEGQLLRRFMYDPLNFNYKLGI